MKNLMIYTREDQKFTEEVETLVKIQIDNSLDLGWLRGDIILVTNFSYEYNGVRSLVIPDTSWKWDHTINKLPAIVYLLKNNMLPDDTIWYHDFDAFQELDIKMDVKLAFTTYGYKPQWNCGSFFFKPSEKDVFDFWWSKIHKRSRADELILTRLTTSGEISADRYKSLGVEYNYNQIIYALGRYDHIVPKVLHFHPNYTFHRSKESNLDIFMYGKSRKNKPIMSDRLIKIFNNHGIK